MPNSPGGGLAERPAGALASAQQEEWTPVRHESGQVYYWNKRTGKVLWDLGLQEQPLPWGTADR